MQGDRGSCGSRRAAEWAGQPQGPSRPGRPGAAAGSPASGRARAAGHPAGSMGIRARTAGNRERYPGPATVPDPRHWRPDQRHAGAPDLRTRTAGRAPLLRAARSARARRRARKRRWLGFSWAVSSATRPVRRRGQMRTDSHLNPPRCQGLARLRLRRRSPHRWLWNPKTRRGRQAFGFHRQRADAAQGPRGSVPLSLKSDRLVTRRAVRRES